MVQLAGGIRREALRHPLEGLVRDLKATAKHPRPIPDMYQACCAIMAAVDWASFATCSARAMQGGA